MHYEYLCYIYLKNYNLFNGLKIMNSDEKIVIKNNINIY